MEKSEVLTAICQALSREATDEAAGLLRRDYPLPPDHVTERRYGPLESTRVFVRDGFPVPVTRDGADDESHPELANGVTSRCSNCRCG